MNIQEAINTHKKEGLEFHQRFKGKSGDCLLIFSKRYNWDYGDKEARVFYAIKILNKSESSSITFKFSISKSALSSQKVKNIIEDQETFLLQCGLMRFKKLLKKEDSVASFPDVTLLSTSPEEEYKVDLLEGLDEEIDKVRYEVLDILRRNKYLNIKRIPKEQLENLICTDSKILDSVLSNYEEAHLIDGSYVNTGIKITPNGEKEIEKMNKVKQKEEEKYSILKEELEYEGELKNNREINCFVIMPIGKEDTIEYENNILVYKNIIKPCVENSGYKINCYHADLIKKSGHISKQVLEALRDDDIVIADLRRNNPNVIYELGVRHSFGKRSILICSTQTEHFFHTTKYRALLYRIDGKSNQDFYNGLVSCIDDIILNPETSDNPVTDIIGRYLNKTTTFDEYIGKKVKIIIDEGGSEVEHWNCKVLEVNNNIIKYINANDEVQLINISNPSFKKIELQ